MLIHEISARCEDIEIFEIILQSVVVMHPLVVFSPQKVEHLYVCFYFSFGRRWDPGQGLTCAR